MPQLIISSFDDAKVICLSQHGIDIEIEDPEYGEGDPSLG